MKSYDFIPTQRSTFMVFCVESLCMVLNISMNVYSVQMSAVDGASSLVSLSSPRRLAASDVVVVVSTLEWLVAEAERSNQVHVHVHIYSL